MRTHHSLYDEVLAQDEEKDHDRHVDLAKDKLTFTECIIALVIAITCVSFHAVFLGERQSRVPSPQTNHKQSRKLIILSTSAMSRTASWA